MNEEFDFQLDHVIEIIDKTGVEIVGLQFPEGFKRRSIKIASLIEENTGCRTLISADPCFGACDIDQNLLARVDVMFHFGHSVLELGKYENVYFIECRSNADIEQVIENALKKLNGRRIGLVTTVQHVHHLSRVSEILETNGMEAVTGTGDSRITYPGQVLGCNFSAARDQVCDEYLYIGSGNFHPAGVSLSTGKRVLVADPILNEVREINTEKIIRQRSAVIAKCMDASLFGIVVSGKNGQVRMDTAKRLKELAHQHDREAHILSMDLVTPEQLLNFKVDAFINTACPRIAIDDVGLYPAPMLTPVEFEIVLGERSWDELVLDEIRGD